MKYLILAMIILLMFSTVKAGVGSSLFNTALKVTRPVDSIKDIYYGNEAWQTLNIYPAENRSNAPVIVFIYGGAWYKGSKEQHHFVADGLVRLGYTVVIPDYIKYPEGKFPTFVEDIALATAWVKNNIINYNGNPNQIFLAGHSAGAHTGALLVTDNQYLNTVGMSKNEIKGFVGLAGPYNFTPKNPKYIETFGSENFEIMKANHHVDGSEPPIKLMHSSGDKTVALFNYQTFRNKLRSEGVQVETKLFEDIGHVSMVLKIHPWFADEIDLAKEIDHFFSKIIN
ncbi:alpha/beta hydrolase fold domain-containing protein [Marinicella sp. S1101]|nr:alpha/beta hydrolase [Marinicella marina]MCX7554391.1 alpha/beta hydrolase fold domain-containing protein [Marinicella marina]